VRTKDTQLDCAVASTEGSKINAQKESDNMKIQSVFITGASSGIGAAFAKHYATQGATLALIGRNQKSLEQLQQQLPNADRHKIYILDVNDDIALNAAAQDFIAYAKIVNVVIASAGVSAGTLTEKPEDLNVFKQVLQTNVIATIATFTPFIAHMRMQAQSQPCRLVGIASVAGIRGLPGAGAYSASKAAVISYCESLRLELKPDNIDVVTIAPGYIDTPMTKVNTYAMPFLMSADHFAKKAASVIAEGSSYAVIPWQMGVVAKIMRLLPNWLYDLLFTNAPRKARKSL
jgi:short-subunit dehydrogenase